MPKTPNTSNSEDRRAVKSYLTQLAEERERYHVVKKRNEGVWLIVTGFIIAAVTVLATLLPSISLPKVSLVSLLEKLTWLVAILLLFQTLISIGLYFKRKRSTRNLKFQERIADCYLNAFDDSKFNPHKGV